MKMNFTDEMREKTKSIHNMSDHLVNLKLGVALSNDHVWAEGLMVFYPIFQFLEQFLERHKDSLIGDLLIEGVMNRTEAFEADLAYYLGDSEWRSRVQKMRPAVEEYLQHLQNTESTNPYLVIAYVYHLYLGLLSGGQILNSKRRLLNKSESKSGERITTFEKQIYKLKRQIKEAMNLIAQELDDESKNAILQEGVNVFRFNNKIVSSIQGVNELFIKKCITFCSFLVVILAALAWFCLSGR